jgi:glutamate 5-kinase
MTKSEFVNFRRIVIKIGSALLTDASGSVNRAWLAGIAEDIAALKSSGRQVLVVSSGAIAIGSRLLGVNRRRARLEELQAAAAAGQVRLVMDVNGAKRYTRCGTRVLRGS